MSFINFIHPNSSTNNNKYSNMYHPQEQYQQRESEPSLYFVNSRQDYSPAYSNLYQATRAESIESTPFKVYVYEKVLSKNESILRLNDASEVIRFELSNQNGRNFSVFERILNEHGLSVQTHKLSYIDEEKDLITLSNERDFQFMLKLFKGQLIKITCERLVSNQTKVHPLFIQRVPQQQASTRQVPSPKRNEYEQFPFFEFLTKRTEENSQPENLLEKALESVFNFDNSSKTESKRCEQKSPVRCNQFNFESCPFRRECSSSNNNTQQANKQVEETRKEAPKSRIIEISLSDLLGGAFQGNVSNQKVDEQKKQQEESKQGQQSFRDYLIEKLKERYSSEEKNASKPEEHKKEPVKETNQSESKKQIEITETKQELAVEQLSEKNDLIDESTPNTTSLLLSNNLETFSNEISEQVQNEQSEEENQTIEEDESSDDETEVVIDSIQESPNTEVSTEQEFNNQEEPTFQYENELNLLSEMGFSSPYTKHFLKKNNGDIQRTVNDLLFVQ